jgi:hypothetical protein
MTAFDDGSLGVWHTSVASFWPTDGVTVAGYRRLGIKDVWMDPYEVNPAEPTINDQPNYMVTKPLMTAVRNLGFYPQLYIDGTHTLDGGKIARMAHDAIDRLSHSGAVQFNIETGNDTDLAHTASQTITAFRQLRQTFVYGLNVVGRKAYVVGGLFGPLDLMRNDPYSRLRVQETLGNMEGETNLLDEVDDYVFKRGFPWARLSFTFAAKSQWGTNALPGFFRRQPDRPITRGDIYNANLLRELGLA